MRTINAVAGKIVPIGRLGENESTAVIFDVSEWLEKVGVGGVFTIYAQRCGDSEAYPVSVEAVGSSVIWAITSADVSRKGYGKAQLVYTIGGAIAKSEVYTTVTGTCLVDTGEVPEPWQAWVDSVSIAVNAAQTAADSAFRRAKDAETWADSAAISAEDSYKNAKRSADASDRSALAAERSAQSAANAAADLHTATLAAMGAEDAAEEATRKAEEAKTAAENAESIVDRATDAAAEAITTAGEAKTTAENAAAIAEGKQDKLIAGANITITGNIISSTGGGGGGSYDDTELRQRIGAIESKEPTWNAKSDFSGRYDDLSGKPTLFDGDYNSLTNKPTIPEAVTDEHINSLISAADKVFVAEYRVATLEQVTAALANGKVVVGKTTSSGQTYYHWNLRDSSQAYYFYTFYNNTMMRLLKLDKATGAWSAETYDIPTAATVDAQIDAKLAAIPYAEGVGF